MARDHNRNVLALRDTPLNLRRRAWRSVAARWAVHARAVFANVRATVCATVSMALLAGCGAQLPITPIRSGEAVAITVFKPARADGPVQVRNLAVGSDLTVGAGSGMVIGGLWGLACGPFAFLCVPMGAGLGAATGSGVGAVVGITGALSEDSVARLRDRLGRVGQSHDVLAELRAQVTERAGRQWQLVPEPAAAAITIELQDVMLQSTRDAYVGLVFRVHVAVQNKAPPTMRAPSQKVYEYIGPMSPLAVWLDERSDFIDTSFSSASQQIAAQIVSEIASR